MKNLRRFFGVLVVSLAISGCNSGTVESKPTAEAPKEEATAAAESGTITLSDEAKTTAGIKIEVAEPRAIQAQLDVPGTVAVAGNAKAVVTPPVAGKILRLYAELGDRVARGSALAEIQSGDLAVAASSIAQAETQAAEAESAVRQQSAELDLARSRFRTASANLERQRRFAKAGAFSQPSLTAARNEVSEAQTELAASTSELAGARSRADRAERLSKEGLVSKADLDQAHLDVQQAQIRVGRAEERLNLAKESFQRESRIGQQGLLNAREIQAAEAEARSAKLEVDRARVQLQGVKSSRDGAYRAIRNARQNAAAVRGGAGGGGSTITLTAPMSGVITERQATVGQAVERSSDLFDIVDLTTVWVTASVPERDVAQVARGASVWVTTPSAPQRIYQGTVQLIGDQLDAKTRTLPIQCRVANPGGSLRPEMFARVRIATGRSVTTLAVPKFAISKEGDQTFVFVEVAGKYEHRKVTLGGGDDRFAGIAEGLKPGERVVTAGLFVLQSELRKGELKGDD